ncbi:MAG: GNAT family N-acetyltransferase [Pseudomonadales bacterium]|nr:GNAT family N-acetyltransferase [Pseudomonadales bacterium]
MRTAIHVWHLELLTRPAPPAGQPGYTLAHVDTPTPEFARFLYAAVGVPWTWYMRLGWTHEQWETRFAQSNVELWVGYHAGQPIGYFELESEPNQSVEICYFGLMPQMIGRGFGRSFLEDAIDKAFTLGGQRVWLHTCSLDHPNALGNYVSRGFEVFREEDIVDDIPDDSPDPWYRPHIKKGRP